MSDSSSPTSAANAHTPAAPVASPPEAKPSAPQPKKRPWWRWPLRLIKLLLALSSLLLALLVAALLLLGVWGSRDGSLPDALHFLQQRGLLHSVSGASGSITGGGQVAALRYESEDLSLDLQGLDLRWQGWALLSGRLQLKRLAADSVRVSVRSEPDDDSPSLAPKDLSLPLWVRVDELAVGDVQIYTATKPAQINAAAAPTWQGQDLAASYRYNGRRHTLKLQSLETFDARIQGDLQLQARGPQALKGQLSATAQVPRDEQSPMQLQAALALSGGLQDFVAKLELAELASPAGAADPAGSQAQLQARLKIWQPLIVYGLAGRVQHLNLHDWLVSLPQTDISGDILPQDGSALSAGGDSKTYLVGLDLRNASAAAWDADGLPVDRATATLIWNDAGLTIRPLLLYREDGSISGEVLWQQAANTWHIAGDLKALDLAALHSSFAPQALTGRLALDTLAKEGQYSGLAFELDAQGTNAAADSAANKISIQRLLAQGSLQGDTLELPQLHLSTHDAQLEGELRYNLAHQGLQFQAQGHAPGLNLDGQGQLAATSGQGKLALQLSDAQQFSRWLNRWPGVPQQNLSGQAQLDANWQGGWQKLQLNALAQVPQLRIQSSDAAALTLRDWRLQLQGPAEQLHIQLSGQGEQGKQRFSADWQAQLQWQQQSADLRLSLDSQQLLLRLQEAPRALDSGWRLEQTDPIALAWQAGRSSFAQGALRITAPQHLQVGQQRQLELQWQDGFIVQNEHGIAQAQLQGQLHNLPQTWLEALAGTHLADAGLTGQIMLQADWRVELAQQLRIHAEIKRSSGDLQIAHADATNTSNQAGLRNFFVKLTGHGPDLQLQALWDSARAGHIQADLSSRLSQHNGAWTWSENSPLQGHIQGDLPGLGLWSALAPTGWRVAGNMQLDTRLSGTRSQPQLQGHVRLRDLAMRSIMDGVELKNGQLDARLQGQQLILERFHILGNEGELSATGQVSWASGQPQLDIHLLAQGLRASNRPDRRVTISGEVRSQLANNRLHLGGEVRIDEALILLADDSKPSLGSDVTVTRRASAAGAAPSQADLAADLEQAAAAGQQAMANLQASHAAPLQIDAAVRLMLGRNFRVRGLGLDTRLTGSLDIKALSQQNTDQGTSALRPEIVGNIRTRDGEYRAYGQWLDIEEGVIRFTGPYDKPNLDILAVRPRTAEKVGVRITGPANNPRVALYAENAMPDSEKLAWLILGREGSNGGAEAAMLQQAAVALLGSGGTQGGIAQSLGLDEIGYRSAETNSDGTVRESSISIGKRLSDKLYLSYERSLSGALGTLYVFYDISRRFTLRAQTNEEASALDLIFTRRYQEWSDSWEETRRRGRRGRSERPASNASVSPNASLTPIPTPP